MANQSNPTAESLARALLRDHPDWEAFAVPNGFSVPFSKAPDHRIEAEFRDDSDTIEVRYDCGGTCGRAEREFYFPDRDREETIQSVCEFVNSIYEGRTVVVVQRLGRITRFLRGDGITELAFFRSAIEK